MENLWLRLLVICPLTFTGGMVDAIAGGGGLITLPAYLIAGLPAQMALGTNKFSATFAGSMSLLRFARSRAIRYKTALPAALCALMGSALGSRLLLVMDERVVQVLLLVLLPLMAVAVLRGKKLDLQPEEAPEPLPPRKAAAFSCLIGLVIGGYDGFFGPGAGTFYILAFVFLLRHDLRAASGNTRIVNFASNLASFATFLANGRVIVAIGIPAAICGMAGSYLGAGLALKNGANIFKPVFLIVFALLLIRVAGGLIGG